MWKITRIFDGEYGCEEAGGFDIVTIENDAGIRYELSIKDSWLMEHNLTEGDEWTAEIFDVCDEKGLPTGRLVERSHAHMLGICHRTAHIWVIRENEKGYDILLQKRSANKDSFPGRFDTSSAGHVMAGDEPRESAIRELYEELSIISAEEQLESIGTFRIKYEKEFHGQLFKDNEIAFVFCYREPVDINKLCLQKEEVENVEWFPLTAVIEEVGKHNTKFCVPRESLALLYKYLF